MTFNATRRELLLGAGLLATTAAFPSLAQDKPKLRFSAVFSEQDIRAEMMKMFADAIKDDFVFEGYYGGNLFKQGTELVALQRGNLEMGNIAPQDISKQIPAWSIVTAAYLFRDAAHLKTFFASDLGARVEADDRGPAWRARAWADLFRRQADRPQAGQEDHHAGRHGGHQATHARRRRLAVSR